MGDTPGSLRAVTVASETEGFHYNASGQEEEALAAGVF
jgi:hypothetical protein